ncbi:CaiB/BaiF CoA transferase family protein [Sphingoaurantiacus capsulatus]|uniref:CaiB/BaiF CoA transferase family protein n=1 Tax=Sphingoaurantiacus capsulatus TaxID=1771310 RepID=A0ABV7X7Q8_9SPHN
MMSPLSGIRVIDFTTMIAGPLATRYLADYGAEVIKIEAPEGDIMRSQTAADDGWRRIFGQYNAGKKSVVLDLKSPEGRQAAIDLAAGADVVVENFQPGVMARLGLDYATLAGVKPTLVYCSLSGFGQEGPMARRPTYAPVIHAHSGFDMAMARLDRSDDAPLTHSVMIADLIAGANAFAAIQTALVHRERNGVGSHVDVSLLESMMQLVGLHYQQARVGTLPAQSNYPPLKSADGHVNIPLISPRTVLSVFKLLGREDWVAEVVAGGAVQARRDEFMPLLREWVAARSSAECERVMTAAGVPCAIYRAPEDIWSDPQCRDRGAFGEVEDAAGSFEVLGAPFRIGDADCQVRRHIPSVGEDTDAVLSALAKR